MLFCGDCLEIMPTLPAASVDLVLCDLPYGTTACKWDAVIPFMPLWEAYRAVRAPKAAVVLHAAQPFTSFLVQSNIAEFRYCWVWHKVSPGNRMIAKIQPLRVTEDICVFYTRQCKYNRQMREGAAIKRTGGKSPANSEHGWVKCMRQNDSDNTRVPVNLITFSHGYSPNNKAVHPTQKPVELAEYLIRTYTNPGDTVLDNCMGSGSTGVACVNTDRRFIGIEKDPAYFEIAQERIFRASIKRAETLVWNA